MNKVTSLASAMSRVHDGMTIMIGGFMGVGTPLKCVEELVRLGVKDLTIISVANAFPNDQSDIAQLFHHHQVKKMITSHTGTCKTAAIQYKKGEVEIEYFPLGTFIEKIRAAGSGLGGVLTQVGLGTLVERGKEKVTVNGKEYLLELPLKAELAIIKGYRADAIGNVQYKGIAIGANPAMASAADFTIAEVNEIVPVGAIDPNLVGTPGVFVKAVVEGYSCEEQENIFENLWVSTNQFRD